MKKSLFILATAIVALTGCQSMNKNNETFDENIGMKNLASVFCLEKGGKLEPKKDIQGNEYALCHLPNGQVVEEWEFYRKHNQ